MMINDIIKITAFVAPIVEIMKQNTILNNTNPYFVDSYQQFKQILIKIKKQNYSISKLDLDVIIIFYNYLRSLYFNLNNNIDEKLIENSINYGINYQNIFKQWVNISIFITVIGMFIVKTYPFFIKKTNEKSFYSDIEMLLSRELTLIDEKNNEKQRLNYTLLSYINNEEFGQVSNLVTPDGEVNKDDIINFNENNFILVYNQEILFEAIQLTISNYFNEKLESINANIKVIIGKEIIDTIELEKI